MAPADQLSLKALNLQIMKKVVVVLFALLAGMAWNLPKTYAQLLNTLKVTSMPGYPQQPDTAYQSQTYSYSIKVSNGTNTVVNSTLEIVFRIDSLETVVVSNPATSLNPGDTISFNISQYFFSQPFYKAGNNIVVVWPRLTGGMSLPADTFYAAVYFVPNSGLAPDHSNSSWINLFPNPATDRIHLGLNINEDFEYVRIWSLTGEQVLEILRPVSTELNIGSLSAGTYMAEAITRRQVFRGIFVKQ